ncbi:proline iminopeptidase-family hydrolase [Mucilaginibacter sp. RS28]|uniref:Proline iminopeptidase-family hydrolase n=1 Tax=Mucilaginibacter straminoryzae TaxID=2932774 RepID=A0A9X1X0L0_9SPHI|nr:proline iminopeptidase-family hydrolase [Mucilaginibacter straminoryzae]MCJ8209037.1 proline iminopeptidase-family hydrolase [Mucilaginibacter straminoryzae]
MKRYLHLLSLLIITIGLTNCKQPSGLTSQEGQLKVAGGKIWYKVISKPQTANQAPLVLLHGGPGFPSYYLSPLFTLASDRPVIFYDQLGCGRSDHTTDTSTMSINAQIKQTEALLNHLGVKNFYLYGHSYGTMLAVEYYFKHPEQVKAMILGSPCMSTKRWVTDADTLMAALREPERTILQNLKKGVPQDSLKEAKALDLYFANFYNHRPHVPRVDSALAQFGNALYTHMWGKNEFTADGTLVNYNRIPDLHRIAVPTLLIAGEFDAARPATVRYYTSLIPNAKFVLVKGAGHSTMNDVPGVDEKAIREFIKHLEKK